MESTLHVNFESSSLPSQSDCVDIPVLSDTILEGTEHFTVSLSATGLPSPGMNGSGDSGVRIDPEASVATVFLEDNDRVGVGFVEESYITDESYGVVTVCIILYGQLERRVMVNVFTVNHTALGMVSCLKCRLLPFPTNHAHVHHEGLPVLHKYILGVYVPVLKYGTSIKVSI